MQAEDMSDRQLLEMAAEAAGLKINQAKQAERDDIGSGDVGLFIINGSSCWNPLRNDNDAFRLALTLNIGIDKIGNAIVENESGELVTFTGSPEGSGVVDFAGTRRAIVRAAAWCYVCV